MSDWAASIVIPAHNEQLVIGRCLDSLMAHPESGRLEVVVVANGCSDQTATVARGYADSIPGLHVIELEAAGKSGALNVGDGRASAFPRIYVDADIELAPGAVAGLVDALGVRQPVVAAPSVRFDVAGASFLVRSFYRIFRSLPYTNRGLAGLGVYGLSAAGRARFDRFPDLQADDLFIQQLFSADERLTSPSEFVVRTPRTWGSLIDVRTRVALGNVELSREQDSISAAATTTTTTTTTTMRALALLVVRNPARILDSLVYLGVTLFARARARVRVPEQEEWLRDETSRA